MVAEAKIHYQLLPPVARNLFEGRFRYNGLPKAFDKCNKTFNKNFREVQGPRRGPPKKALRAIS